jgi:putative hemolysin
MKKPEILMRTGILAQVPRFTVQFSRSNDELMETQRLRYEVFAEEMGAQIDDDGTRLDRDAFDIHCRHLYVRDNASDRVIACTRILTDDRAADAGGFYSSNEFELGALERLPGRSMEIGRTCVDREFRSGAVIALLWSGIAGLIERERFDYLFGCASVGLEDGGANAHAVIETLRTEYLSPAYHRVQPREPLPRADVRPTEPGKMPPLLKAYVNLGAKACGEPYHDPDFNCADIFMLLNVMDLNPRYARRFFGRDQVHENAGAALA